MSLFGKSHKKETVLILDIGNGSVGGALVELSEKNPPKIVYSNRQPIAVQTERDSKVLLDSMLRLLSVVIDTVYQNGVRHGDFSKHGHARIHEIYCVFSSPWYMSQTKTIKIEKAKPFVVTKHFVDDVAMNEEKIFRAAIEKGDYSHIFGGPVNVIEHHIVETRINGYGVDNPYGKTGQTFELSLFTSVAAEEILNAVQKEIHKHFNFRTCRFFSFSLISFSSIRDMFPTDQDFMFLDITGEVTDVSITRKNVLLETISFPLGRASLVRRLAKSLSVSPEVALSYIRLQAEGGLSADQGDRLTKSLAIFKQEWCDYFHKSILDLARDIAVPRKIFFTADRDAAPYWTDMLAHEKCTQLAEGDSEADSEFEIVYLDTEKIGAHLDKTPRAEKDEFLALEALFFNKLFSATDPEHVV